MQVGYQATRKQPNKPGGMKPKPEDYGYYEAVEFDDDASGWTLEGGEEKYYKALKAWEDAQSDLKQI